MYFEIERQAIEAINKALDQYDEEKKANERNDSGETYHSNHC